jgi:Ca2+-binding RTX toxin-like protein
LAIFIGRDAAADTANSQLGGILDGFTGGTVADLTDAIGDIFVCGSGDDFVFAGGGDDVIEGNSGADRLNGYEGNDTIFANEGVNPDGALTGAEMLGHNGHDSLVGSGGADTLEGGLGNDTLLGGSGNDALTGNEGSDKIFGGAGGDLLMAGGNSDIDEFDNIDGGAGDDTIFGSVNGDTLHGGDGDDVINGGNQVDTIEAGAGDDLIVVADNGRIDDINGGTGADTLDLRGVTGRGAIIDLLAASWTLTGYVFSAPVLSIAAVIGTPNGDTIGGGDVGETLNGGAGDDQLNGNDGNDRLTGGAGLDQLRGGAGDDVYFVDAASEAIEAPGEGIDTVRSSVSYALGADLENLNLLGSGNISGKGNGLANRLTGNGGNNLLTGGPGRDVLTGGGGFDRFDFNAAAESGVTGATRDAIADFQAGTATTRTDRIDMATIDANTTVAGDQGFLFGGPFTAGHIRAAQAGNNVLLQFNTDADAMPEITLLLQNVLASNLNAGDFIL